jgi:hypothetical protein
MPRAADLATTFASSNLAKARIKAFASHVAEVEADSGITFKRALINGIPPFDDLLGVEFDVPRAKLGKVIDKLLSNPRVNPNVIVDGIPSVDMLRVRVMGR